MACCKFCSCCSKRDYSLCCNCNCCSSCCGCCGPPPLPYFPCMPCLPSMPCMAPMPCLPYPPPPCRIIREHVNVPCPYPVPVPVYTPCYTPNTNTMCPLASDQKHWEPEPPCSCRWPHLKNIHCPGEPVMPGYRGHIPGLKFHGAARTFGDATRDTRCIMSQWFKSCRTLPWRIFER